MKDAVFTGSDVAAALRAAEESLGVSGRKLHYVVLEEGSPASASRAASPARIAVLLEATAEGREQRTSPGRASTPRVGSPPVHRGDRAPSFDASVENVGQAISASLEAAVSLALDRHGERIEVGVSGEGAAALEDTDGETLLALETVLQRIAGRCGEKARVVVANPARKARREAALRAEALRLAAEVKMRGLPRLMPPLNSYERRVVHMALSEVGGIKTYSVGEGSERRLTIALSSEPVAD